MSWVIMKQVCWVLAQIASSSSCRLPRVSASSAENGSSISRIFGSIEKARAMPTRCFMPPDSCAGFLSSAPVRWTRSMYFWHCSRTLAFGQSAPARFDREGDVAVAPSSTASARGAETRPRGRGLVPDTSRPSTMTPPELALSSPARMFSSVVLPQPEWPIRQTNSPSSTPNQRSPKTSVSPLPSGRRKALGESLDRDQVLRASCATALPVLDVVARCCAIRHRPPDAKRGPEFGRGSSRSGR